MNARKLAATSAVGLLLLSGCSAATQDRPADAGGKDPDAVAPASHVTVYLNANNVPNVAIFCTGDIAWASTLSGGDSGKDKASSLVRLPEKDTICAKPKAG